MRDLADRAMTGPAVRALLVGAIDYAGLFPPAALSMDEAVRNYADYAGGEHAWALGRFVVPMARLDEFDECTRPLLERVSAPWRLSVLAGAGGAAEWSRAERLQTSNVTVDAIEMRAQSGDDVHAAASVLPSRVERFYEISIANEPAELIAAIGRAGGNAKVRTGGVTADAFPSVDDLARFIVHCVRTAVPFKATAGLHHALRSTYRLTYEAKSPRGEMFGFLNVLLAAAFAASGSADDEVRELLGERDIRSFKFDADSVSWRGRRIALRQLAHARGSVAVSFGSCSFTEPIAELQGLGLL